MKVEFWILLLVVLFIFGVVKHATIFYERFVIRNRMIKDLADEFGLQFQSDIPKFLKFILTYNFVRIQLNEVKGTINNHMISIKDTFYSSLLFLDNRQTIITIDGQKIGGSLQDLTLGNHFVLTPINELRDLLKSEI
jgi:hypothetical protein